LKYSFLAISFIFLANSMLAQSSFQRTIGGALDENIYSFVETASGYLFVGSTTSDGAGGQDILLIETGTTYNIEKSLCIGGWQDDFPRSVIASADGGYVIVGSTYSFGAGNEDIIVLKLTEDLNLEWVKVYGASNVERGFCIIEDQGNFVIGATTKTGKGALVLKIDSQGNIIWSNTYGFDENSARCFSVIKNESNNYLFTGPYQVFGSNYDFMTIEIDPAGNLVEAKSLLANGNDHTRDVLEVPGEGVYILGHSTSFGGGTWDLLLVKLDINGNFDWAKNFSNPTDLWASQLIWTSSNELLLTAHAGSFSDYNNDIVILKCGRSGDLRWSKSFGGTGVENQMFGNHKTTVELESGEFLSMGQTSSFGIGGYDILLFGFNNEGNSECNFHDFSVTETSENLVRQSINLPVTVFTPTITNPSVSIKNIALSDSLLCPLAQPPVAGFTSSETEICIDNCIEFQDTSTNMPDEWEWFFEGGLPEYSSEQSPGQICYSDTGCFDVQLIARNSAGSDTLLITDYICVRPEPEIDLGNDTVLCLVSNYVLSAPIGYSNYIWNTGSLMSEILVDSTGLYWVEVENEYSCITRDSINISFGYAESVDIGPDQDICQGDTITLEANNTYSQYLWNDGSNNSTKDVSEEGIYWLEVGDSHGCTARDSVYVGMVAIPDVSIGTDSSFCGDFTYLLSAGQAYDTYLWQDGSDDEDYLANYAGMYWVEVSKDGCIKSDTILLIEDCPTNLWFPNCFTPDADGINDDFKPVYENISQYKLYVFNRWGQQIFESVVVDEGWDGTFKGEECPGGVYIFLARYFDNKANISREVTGSVTILR